MVRAGFRCELTAMQSPLVSVVILNYKRREQFARCLESVRRQSYANRELIVVDNNSQDGIGAYLAEHAPEARLIELAENGGAAAGRNAGIAAARGEIVITLDNDVFFFADTLDKVIYKFDYDHAAGTVRNRRVFADTSADGAAPDGGTIDEAGGIWNAQWDGWRVVRYSPDGSVDRVVMLPVQKPTSCMFGGPDLRTLFITSAIWDLTPDKLADQPQAGGLFAVDVGVRGVPEPRFAG